VELRTFAGSTDARRTLIRNGDNKSERERFPCFSCRGVYQSDLCWLTDTDVIVGRDVDGQKRRGLVRVEKLHAKAFVAKAEIQKLTNRGKMRSIGDRGIGRVLNCQINDKKVLFHATIVGSRLDLDTWIRFCWAEAEPCRVGALGDGLSTELRPELCDRISSNIQKLPGYQEETVS
jgi:hypothetical protein